MTTTIPSPAATVKASALASDGTRWGQLVAGIVCMVMIANLQYGWTLFVNPIDEKYHWGTAAIQVAFSIFIATETWLVPVEGWFVDRFGPRVVVAFGGVLVAIAWAINSIASSLEMLYFAAAIGGVGAARSTAPASVMLSNGFPTGAVSPRASRPPVSAPARQPPWSPSAK
jgi:MFS family permease